MSSRLARMLAASYAGTAPVFLAALLALAVTALAWPALEHTAIYTDVVAGETTWANIDKARDFRALYLFFAATAIFSVSLGKLWKRIRRRTESTTAERSDSALLRAMLIFATLPALWRLAILAHAAPSDTYTIPWTAIGAAIVAITVALVLSRRLRRGLPTSRTREQALLTLLIAVLGAFACIGITTVLGRLLPVVNTQLRGRAFFFGAGGAACALVIAFLSRRIADPPERRSRREFLVLLAVQAPLPLLYFALIPPPLFMRGSFFVRDYRLALPLALGGLVLLIWILLWRRWQVLTTTLKDAGVAVRIDELERALSPICIAAVALFVALPVLPLPHLAVQPDHLHFGETALPWQQWTEWGKLPYVDFTPIHGLMPLSSGFFNAIFFDGAASGFASANLLLAALFVLALFFTARALIGTVMAVVVTAFALSPMMSDRFFFFSPALFILAHPRLLAEPRRWLLVWLVVSPLMILYNAALGTAFTLGTLLAAIAMAYRLARADRRSLIVLLGAIGGVAVGVILLPNSREMVAGFVRYVLENQAFNNAANGIAWEQSFHPALSRLDYFRQATWGIARVSWIIVLLIAGQLAWRELARPKEQRREAVLWLGALIIPTMLLAAQWALGRIDPGGGSRTDALSYVALLQILPVLLLVALPIRTAAARTTASLALAVTLTVSIIRPSAIAWALSGNKALAARVMAPEDRMIRGTDVGLPKLGAVLPNRTVDEARALAAALGGLLRPGETYFNLGYASDFYYYLDLPVPTLYAETLVPASGAMQGRMLRQIAAHRPPVALAAPWVTSSLRSYYLYRDFVLRYAAIRRERFVFLVEPARAPDVGPIGSDEQVALLDSAYRIPHLRKVPSAWGHSWPALAARFTSVVALGSDRLRRRHDVTEASDGVWIVSGPRPAVEFQLSDLGLRGAEADFLKLDFVGAPGSELLVSWASMGRSVGEPVALTIARNSETLLIPLGATPSWLLSKRLDSLRLEMAGDAAAAGRRFTIKNVSLLRLGAPY